MTNQEIITRGELIRDETVTGANTAQRVGEAFVAIGENLKIIDEKIGSTIWVDLSFTEGVGLVSSDDGSIVSTGEGLNHKYAEIVLTGTVYTKLKFNTKSFGGNYGYAFCVNDVWRGTKSTINGETTADIPTGATAFRTCWYKTHAQNIQGFRSQLVTDELRLLININSANIAELSNNVNDLYEKLGSETFENITYTPIENRVVNSQTGALVEISGYNSVEIPLNGTYSKIKFLKWNFTGNYGYGFIVGGAWQGMKMTARGEIIIDVPEGATIFKTCWSTQTDWFVQSIQGAVLKSVFIDLQEQINDNINSITNVQKRIGEIIAKMGTEEYVSVSFTPSVGLVSSEDGSITTTGAAVDYLYTEIDLTDTDYTKIKFLSRYYGGKYGYGFVVGGVWQGTRGTINDTIEVNIPEGATSFKCCWANNKTQAIYGLIYNDVFDSLQTQINKVGQRIDNIDFQSLIFNPFTISVPDCRSIIPNLTVSSVYGYWDDLIEQYPDYLSTENIGLDESGDYMMRKIEFGIKDTNNTNNVSEPLLLRKVMVIANIHGWGGDSHIPAYLVYWLAKFILDNKSTNELAQWVLSNFYFVIIPIANPWGFDNGTRGNSNNIDINRNFDADFVPNADPYNTGTTSGTTAASEAETQHIQAVMDANDDMWMYVDFHSQPATQPLVSKAAKAGRMQYLPNSADMLLRQQCEKMLYFGKLVANDWIENIPTSTGGQSMRYPYKRLGVSRTITLEAAGHPDEKTNNGTTWDYFNTKAMTGAARLFLSLLRFEN